MAAIIEAEYKDNVMKWPNSIAPFHAVIIPSFKKNDDTKLLQSKKIYQHLKENNIDVLLDDIEENVSVKFKKFDLIGVPYQIILGSKSIKNKFEFKEVGGKTETLSLEEIINKLINKRNLN